MPLETPFALPRDTAPTTRPLPQPAAAGRVDRPDGAHRLLVILGHPRDDSLCAGLATAYAEGARNAGCTVRVLKLSALTFNPDVVTPSPASQTLEPDLEIARDLIDWAQHIVLVFPNWWGTMPARLKGFLDRVMYPHFAFREEGGHYYGLLAPRTAELLITMDVPRPVYRWIHGAPGAKSLSRATLGLCGISTTAITTFSPASHTDAATRGQWIDRARALGASRVEGPRGPVRRRLHALGSWLLAIRPQFYPMSALAYTLGALLAAGALNVWAFVLGLVAMVALKIATVLTNDLFDRDSDSANTRPGPFNGGGRSLQERGFALSDLWRGARLALAVSALAALALLLTVPAPLTVLAVFIVLAILALGYTVPPLRLSHRGLGELVVALTHGPGVLMLGHVAQGGSVSDPVAWTMGGVIGLAVLPAIILSGIPDCSADRDAGKATLVVRLGIARSLWAAMTLLVASAIGAVAVSVGAVPVGPALAVVALPHAAVLLWFMWRYLADEGAPERRVDLLLALGLSYVAWFVILPAWALV